MDIHQANQHIARLDQSAEHRSAPFATNGAVRWRVFGKADARVPLVLVHGGHGSWLHWIRNIEALSRDHWLLVPDMPGFGDSNDLADGAGIPELADALTASLDALLGGPRTVDLAGFSLGAVVSARMAANRGAVRRLALLGSPGSETLRRPKAKLIRWRDTDEATQNAALRHNLLAHMMYADSNVDALAFRAYADAIKATRLRTHGTAHAVPLKALLSQYRNPILFLYGEKDVICTPEIARINLENIADQRECRVISGGGHWIQLERAEAVNSALTNWFAVSNAVAPAVALTE